MPNVNQLIHFLVQQPQNAPVYAYEGEDTGLVIVLPGGNAKFFHCAESDEDVETYRLADRLRNRPQ